jgi:hypothetical protein
VIAHEYGHLVATELSHRFTGADGLPRRTTVEDRLRELALADDSKRLFFLGHELFADLFATFVCGPAYPAYCLRYRFAPTSDPDDRHPHARRRLREMLRLLVAMAKVDKDNRDFAATGLPELWTRTCADANAPEEPPDDGLDDLAAELHDMILADTTLARVRYTASDHVASGSAGVQLAAGQVPKASIAVILAGAWRWRLQRERTSTPALQLKREVAEVEATALAAMGPVDG